MASTDLNQANKRTVAELWRVLDAAGTGDPTALFSAVMGPDVVWHAHAPVGTLVGTDAVVDECWAPLLRSFPDVRRETFLFFGGESNGRVDGDLARDGRMWVTGTGVLHATFTEDYLTIPATGQPVSLRWGEFCCVEDGRISEVFFVIDLVDLMQQAGFEVLPPSRGRPGVYPAPAAADGVMHDAADSQVSAYSLDHIRRFIFDGLNAFDEFDLASMGMADWFHPEVHWYGPGGIGACMGFSEFETLHQQPWLVAYPDRQVQDLDALFAEGAYSAAPGWAGVTATHTGPYLGVPATDRAIEFNGLDWWKRGGEQYIENWVFVDMVHLFRQFGVDLLARMHTPSG